MHNENKILVGLRITVLDNPRRPTLFRPALQPSRDGSRRLEAGDRRARVEAAFLFACGVEGPARETRNPDAGMSRQPSHRRFGRHRKVGGHAARADSQGSRIQPEGIEVVFFAADSGTEKLRDTEYMQNLARRLSTEDATGNNVLLGQNVNAQPVPKPRAAACVSSCWAGTAWRG